MKSILCLLLSLGWLSVAAARAQSTSAAPPDTAATGAAVVSPPPPAPDSVVAPVVRVLTGTVLNDQNEPVPGAVVSVVAEAANEASTNSVGAFVLRSKAEKPLLQVVCAGYLDSEQPGSYVQPVVFQLTAAPDYERQLNKKRKAAAKAYKQQ